jgi:hypothetical protein
MCLAVDASVSVTLCSVRQCISQSEVDWIRVCDVCHIATDRTHKHRCTF